MLEGNILTPQGWVLGRLHIQDGRIQRIEGEPCDPAGNADPYLLPGFIDLHVHGGGGRDIMEGGDAFATIARTHRRFGTTSLLATTMTAPREEIADILSQLGAYCRRSLEGGSRILGVHLEGPTSTPASSARSPTSPMPRCSRKSRTTCAARRSG